MSTLPVQKKQEYLSIFQSIQNEKGRLLKQGKTFKMMSKRYFTIKADSLIYYKERNSQKIRGMVNLLNCSYLVQTDKKNKQGIRISGQSNSYEIWIIPNNKEELEFYLFYLNLAKQGNFNVSVFDIYSNTPQKSLQAVDSKLGSFNLNQQQIKTLNFNEMINGSLLNFKKDPNRIYTLDALSVLNNNQSIIQVESDINIIQTTMKNAPNIQKEETIIDKQNSRILNSSNGKNVSQFRQINQMSPQKPINLMSMLDKYDKGKNVLRPEDCNVETTDDIPNTSFMNQYEFSYYRLDNKVPPTHIQPVSSRQIQII